MRTTLLFPAALVCSVLVGQAAGPETLVQRFNANLPSITQLLNDLKFQEAVDKAQALIPAKRPVFVSKDPGSIGESLEDGRGMLALIKLQASCLGAQGQWEKVVDLNRSRVEYAGALRSDLGKALTELNAQWSKVSEEGKAYILQNEPKIGAIEKSIAALQLDIKNHNEKKVTLDKKQLEEIQKVRIPQVQKDEQEMLEIKAKVAAYREAQGRFQKFTGWVTEATKQADGMVKEAEEGLAKSQDMIKTQRDEVTKFNSDMLKKDKKFKAEGSSKWVEAVMRDKTNLTKLDTPRLQMQLLSRLLVLSPADKTALKAIENVKQGRDPFFVEKPASKSKKATKK